MEQTKSFYKKINWSSAKTSSVAFYYASLTLVSFIGVLPNLIILLFIIPGYFALKTKEKFLDYFIFISILYFPIAIGLITLLSKTNYSFYTTILLALPIIISVSAFNIIKYFKKESLNQEQQENN